MFLMLVVIEHYGPCHAPWHLDIVAVCFVCCFLNNSGMKLSERFLATV